MLTRLLCLCALALPASAEVFSDPQTGAERCHYVLSPPSRANADFPAGVIVTLHPNGGTAEPMVSHTRRMLDQLGLGQDYLVVGVKAVGSSWTRSYEYNANQDLQNIVDLVAWLHTQMPIDPRRIGVWGFSGGGMTACLLAVNRPRMLHTTISFGGYGFDDITTANPRTEAPLFYSVAGDKDPNWGFIERALPKQERGGLHWISYQARGVGHTMTGPQLDPLLLDALQLLVTRRVASVAPLPAHQQAIDNTLNAIASGKRPERMELAMVSQAGGAEAAPVTRALLASDNRRHRSAAFELAASGAIDNQVFRELAELARSGDARRTLAPALSLLARYAQWRYPAAEQALADLVTDQEVDLERRQAALQAIGVALQLTSVGPRRDHAVLWDAVTAAQADAELATTAQAVTAQLTSRPR